jgi:hypothetical protein
LQVLLQGVRAGVSPADPPPLSPPTRVAAAAAAATTTTTAAATTTISSARTTATTTTTARDGADFMNSQFRPKSFYLFYSKLDIKLHALAAWLSCKGSIFILKDQVS